ncbi:MAG: TetR/AcrR family transcriptional regulator [Paracoccus sp. (in: a-proteobacteria)]|uniref:TetR/AcrR family transcriptional regulator n=1 Tax=Paracoccus sp. TaxID=267 RepID=UPI0026E0A1B4|nr:TetR/AcrR family transcriptional regulator [Paracoccus sp. (in: a-proteobacteria)]MDO5619949.1 TetR/AcrR family transcriptional regulator [Paracoccus sp. (in: a-proteobacteria)]
MARDPRQTRLRILTAAETLTRTQGARAVSLEAVAEQAGISKGGLLYHFPSKEALMQGLVQHYLDQAVARLDAADADRPNGILLQLLNNFEQDWQESQSASGLLAAVTEHPGILAPVAEFNDQALRRLRAGSTDPLLAELIFHSLNGLWSARMLGIHSPDDKHVMALIATLRQRLV